MRKLLGVAIRKGRVENNFKNYFPPKFNN